VDHLDVWVGLAVQTIVIAGGGWAMVLRTNWSTLDLKEDLKAMQEELHKLAEVVTIQAVQTARIDHLSERLTLLQRNLEDLRRGDGWINHRPTET
jgi:cob(I)alamin adenosyltransferase